MDPERQNHVSHVRLGIRKKGSTRHCDRGSPSSLIFCIQKVQNIIFVASAEHKLRKSSNSSKEFQTFEASNSGIFRPTKPSLWSHHDLFLGKTDHLHQASSLPFQRGEVTTTSNARRLLLSNQNTWIKNVEALKEFVSHVFHTMHCAPRFHPSLDTFLLRFFFFVELQLLKCSLVKPLSQGWSVVTQRTLRHFTDKCNFFKLYVARAQSWIWRSMQLDPFWDYWITICHGYHDDRSLPNVQNDIKTYRVSGSFQQPISSA